jgi:hypothetical protein
VAGFIGIRSAETLAEIGRSYNVSGWTISRLASGKTF